LEEIFTKLFTNWELDTWANVLEIVGFTISILSLFITLFLKSEISKLKLSYIFDKRIKSHLNQLSESATNLNNYFIDYDANIRNTQLELSKCISELNDLKNKLGFFDSLKSKYLIRFIKKRLTKTFEQEKKIEPTFKTFVIKYINRYYKTTSEDVWIIYNRIHGVIRQVENIKKNKDKSL